MIGTTSLSEIKAELKRAFDKKSAGPIKRLRAQLRQMQKQTKDVNGSSRGIETELRQLIARLDRHVKKPRKLSKRSESR